MIRTEVADYEDKARSRLAELYERHAPSAFRFAYLLTGDSTEAEDLVHDAVVRIAGRFADLRSDDAFPSYLRRAIVNLATSRRRRRHVERDWRTRQHVPVMPAYDPGPGDELWAAMSVLPERQRAAIVLRFYEDLSEAQTAEILGCRPGTVKSLVSRGLDQLRKQVSP